MTRHIALRFSGSGDAWGRVTIYKLGLWAAREGSAAEQAGHTAQAEG